MTELEEDMLQIRCNRIDSEFCGTPIIVDAPFVESTIDFAKRIDAPDIIIFMLECVLTFHKLNTIG